MKKTKKFIEAISSCALFFWLVRAIASGIIQSSLAIFMKKIYEKWKKRKK